MTNPQPLKAIVRYANNKVERFLINGIDDIGSAHKTLIDESGAKVGLVLVPKTTPENFDYEPDAA